MKINVKDKSNGATKVLVRMEKPIWTMDNDELIEALDLKNKILEYHYEVEDRYKVTEDLYSEGLRDYVSELIYDYAQSAEYDKYDELAQKLIEEVREEIIDEINDRDENAMEGWTRL